MDTLQGRVLVLVQTGESRMDGILKYYFLCNKCKKQIVASETA